MQGGAIQGPVSAAKRKLSNIIKKIKNYTSNPQAFWYEGPDYEQHLQQDKLQAEQQLKEAETKFEDWQSEELFL